MDCSNIIWKLTLRLLPGLMAVAFCWPSLLPDRGLDWNAAISPASPEQYSVISLACACANPWFGPAGTSWPGISRGSPIDTGVTPSSRYTGKTEMSKIVSKTVFAAVYRGKTDQNYLFGVAYEKFVSLVKLGFQTRLNTAYTDAFWTKRASLPMSSARNDAPPSWCAFNR
jgi:hypothetical protein